jgi:hypothetical protein
MPPSLLFLDELGSLHFLLSLDEELGSLHFLFTIVYFFPQLCLGAFKIQAHCFLDKYA